MNAGDLAAVVISVAVGIAVVGLLFTLASAMRAMAVFRRSVQEITSQTLPLIADVHAAIKQANTDLMKVDTLLETAESISTTVDSASRLAYTAFSNPMVKLLSLGTGVTRAFRLLRRRRALAK
jgi:uncharacterized protein YoxC